MAKPRRFDKGDVVRVTAGGFEGVEGEISLVDTTKGTAEVCLRVFIRGPVELPLRWLEHVEDVSGT